MERLDQDAPAGFKARASVQFLPKCAECGAPHPLARRPAVASDTCLDCGAVLPEAGELIDVDAELGGVVSPLARFFFWVAKVLTRWAGRLTK